MENMGHRKEGEYVTGLNKICENIFRMVMVIEVTLEEKFWNVNICFRNNSFETPILLKVRVKDSVTPIYKRPFNYTCHFLVLSDPHPMWHFT